MPPRVFEAPRSMVFGRTSPEQLEGRRRAAVQQQGRIVAGMVIDVLDNESIVHEYTMWAVYAIPPHGTSVL